MYIGMLKAALRSINALNNTMAEFLRRGFCAVSLNTEPGPTGATVSRQYQTYGVGTVSRRTRGVKLDDIFQENGICQRIFVDITFVIAILTGAALIFDALGLDVNVVLRDLVVSAMTNCPWGVTSLCARMIIALLPNATCPISTTVGKRHKLKRVRKIFHRQSISRFRIRRRRIRKSDPRHGDHKKGDHPEWKVIVS
jgi:hypothetical protein